MLDDKGQPVLYREFEKVLEEVKNKKATGSDVIPTELIKATDSGLDSKLAICNVFISVVLFYLFLYLISIISLCLASPAMGRVPLLPRLPTV